MRLQLAVLVLPAQVGLELVHLGGRVEALQDRQEGHPIGWYRALACPRSASSSRRSGARRHSPERLIDSSINAATPGTSRWSWCRTRLKTTSMQLPHRSRLAHTRFGIWSPPLPACPRHETRAGPLRTLGSSCSLG